MTLKEVKEYEQILAKEDWTYDEFCVVTSIRKFNAEHCNCKKNTLYNRCHHRRAAAIRLGRIKAEPIEEPDDPKSFVGRPPIPGKSRQSKKKNQMTYCFVCFRECGNFHNLKSHTRGAKHIDRMQSLWDTLQGEAEEFKFDEKISLLPFFGSPKEVLSAGRFIFISGDDVSLELHQAMVRAVEPSGK